MRVVNLIHIYFIGVTEGDIQVALREKEAQLVKDSILPLHAVTPSNFVVMGLELEDQQ